MLSLQFTPYPTLTTERLILRRPRLTDDKETFVIRSNEQVNKYLDRPKAETIEDAQKFLQKLNDGIDKNEWISWVIHLKGNETLLGSVCFWNISVENATAEIGFELNPQSEGKGIMSEAMKEAIRFGFAEMQLRAIEGWTHPGNKRSIRLMKKHDFKRDPHAENQHVGKEYFNNTVIYTLVNIIQM